MQQQQQSFDGISSLDHVGLATSAGTQGKQQQKLAVTVAQDKNEEPPILLRHDCPHLLSVLDKADVVLQVLDARDPASFMSVDLGSLVAKRPGLRRMLVLNKIGESGVLFFFRCSLNNKTFCMMGKDTCPRESVAASITHLRTFYRRPVFLFRSASLFLPAADQVVFKPKSDVHYRPDDALGRDAIVECLNMWEAQKVGTDPLVVAVVGVVNVRLSALLRILYIYSDLMDSRARALSSIVSCARMFWDCTSFRPRHPRLVRRRRRSPSK